MAQLSRLGSPNSKAVAMASDGIVSDNRQESMASDGLFGAVDPIPPVPFVGESKAIALATLGVIAHNKAISMASLGLFGIASPIPPPAPTHTHSPNYMMLSIGRLM